MSALTNASAAASSAATAAQEAVQRERAAARQALPSVFTVRVLGFGSEAPDGRQDAPAAGPPTAANGRTVDGYDDRNLVQVLGHGRQLDRAALSLLNDDERRRLQQDH